MRIFAANGCRWLFVLAFAGSLLADEPAPQFRIAGYLPEWRQFNAEAAQWLTDLYLFSAEPNASGEIDVARLKRTPWAKLREFKERSQVRLWLCVGGWGRSEHFPASAKDETKRKAFVQSAVKILQAEKLDGLDLDWEHPHNKAEEEDYGRLVTDLRQAFAPHKLLLSITIAASQRPTAEAVKAVDFVQIMSYDRGGARHSTYEDAKADVQRHLDRGTPAAKLVLGLPFYGRGMQQRGGTLTYREILAKYKPEPNLDEIDGLFFNGPGTIAKKTEIALDQKLAGVMIWEIGQDAPGEASLLKVIQATVAKYAKR